MKTQISRDSHQPERDYSGVYLQQGRLITDADWNELVDVMGRRLRTALNDVVGSGAPRNGGLDVVLVKESGGIAPEFDPRRETEAAFAAREEAFFADDEPVSLRLQPGALTVEGVSGRLVPARANGSLPGGLFDFAEQRDFPQAPPPPRDQLPSLEVFVLYADLWERPVTVLEDDRLRDAALRGADTATRTQTLVQIKYSLFQDPFYTRPGLLPGKGDAPLRLQLRPRRVESEGAPEAEARIGNYLFRVEVHDVSGPADAPDTVILKWSRENGAEAYVRIDARGEEQPAPADFEIGEWVYESYTDVTERHLGVHLADPSVFAPQRGVLSTRNDRSRADLGIGNSDLKLYVRRWDGGCTLIREGDIWRLAPPPALAIDRGVTLGTNLNEETHGYVRLENGRLAINLEALLLELDLAGHRFVAGDYWNAPVREFALQPGDAVLGDTEGGATPIGIEHRYQFLKEVQLANDRPRLVHPLEISRPLRRYSSLTELRAGDIASQPTNGGGLDTVAQALDRLASNLEDLDGDVWRVTRDWIPGLTVDPPSSQQAAFSHSGYQRLPSGLLIQWGRVVTGAGPRFRPINFPMTFPNEVLNIVANNSRNAAEGAQVIPESFSVVRPQDTSQFMIDLGDFRDRETGVMFFAIGR